MYTEGPFPSQRGLLSKIIGTVMPFTRLNAANAAWVMSIMLLHPSSSKDLKLLRLYCESRRDVDIM